MSQQIPTLIPTNKKTPIYSNSSISPWARQPPIIHPSSNPHPYPKHDQLPKEIHDQVHLLKIMQQSLETEQKKLVLMMNRFQASNTGQHSIEQIIANQDPTHSPRQTSAVLEEDPGHFSIEDLVVKEINKRRSNTQL